MKYYYIETDTEEIYIKDYPTAKEIQDNLHYKDQKVYPIQEKSEDGILPDYLDYIQERFEDGYPVVTISKNP